MSDTAQNQIAELKVSGHTMALDPGLYCVFGAPGSVAPAAETGLPTVRISASPGYSAGAVEVVGLNVGGWVGPDSATLVRVAGARSNVLVTVYQAKDTKAEAPQLQVVRISGPAEPAPAAPKVEAATAAGPAASRAVLQQATKGQQEISVIAHIYGRGDVGGQVGAWMGEPGSKRWVEGFGIAPVGSIPASDIEYQAVLGRGWLSPWSQGGQFCGSRSMSLPILGLRVRLRGVSAETHEISLSASFIDGTQVGPVSDGEPCEATSLAALEAFQVVIQPRGAARAVHPASKAPVVASKAKQVPQPAAKGRAAKPATPKPTPAKVAPAKPVGKTKAAVPAKAAGKPAAPKPTARAIRAPAPARRR